MIAVPSPAIAVFISSRNWRKVSPTPATIGDEAFVPEVEAHMLVRDVDLGGVGNGDRLCRTRQRAFELGKRRDLAVGVRWMERRCITVTARNLSAAQLLADGCIGNGHGHTPPVLEVVPVSPPFPFPMLAPVLFPFSVPFSAPPSVTACCQPTSKLKR